MEALPQDQVWVVILNTHNHVLDAVTYWGNAHTAARELQTG